MHAAPRPEPPWRTERPHRPSHSYELDDTFLALKGLREQLAELDFQHSFISNRPIYEGNVRFVLAYMLWRLGLGGVGAELEEAKKLVDQPREGQEEPARRLLSKVKRFEEMLAKETAGEEEARSPSASVGCSLTSPALSNSAFGSAGAPLDPQEGCKTPFHVRHLRHARLAREEAEEAPSVLAHPPHPDSSQPDGTFLRSDRLSAGSRAAAPPHGRPTGRDSERGGGGLAHVSLSRLRGLRARSTLQQY